MKTARYHYHFLVYADDDAHSVHVLARKEQKTVAYRADTDHPCIYTWKTERAEMGDAGWSMDILVAERLCLCRLITNEQGGIEQAEDEYEIYERALEDGDNTPLWEWGPWERTKAATGFEPVNAHGLERIKKRITDKAHIAEL